MSEDQKEPSFFWGVQDPYHTETICSPPTNLQESKTSPLKGKKGDLPRVSANPQFSDVTNVTNLPACPTQSLRDRLTTAFSSASNKFFMHEVFDRPHSGDFQGWRAVWIQERICMTHATLKRVFLPSGDSLTLRVRTTYGD